MNTYEFKLDQIEHDIALGLWRPKSKKLFGGAGVVFSKSKDCVTEGCGYTYVIHKQARELSALMYAIQDAAMSGPAVKDVFAGQIYQDIADAAVRAIDSGTGLREIELAMIEEARKLVPTHHSKLYFAYGSNMDLLQMADRCPDSYMLCKGVLRGWEFALDSAGVATVQEDTSHDVEGILWRITLDDERTLDSYEGVASGCYERLEDVLVESEIGVVDALVYRSLRSPDCGVRRNGYMERVAKAGRDLGLSEDYVEMLESFLD